VPVSETEGAALSICNLVELAMEEGDKDRRMALLAAVDELAFGIAQAARREAEEAAEDKAATPPGPRPVPSA
jgi:hypothetical protein